MFRARTLPREFAAPPVENAQTVDLSRLAGATVSSELIEFGDVIEVTIGAGQSGKEPLTTPVRVGEDGVANVPLVGGVLLAGLDLPASEQAIRAAALTRGVFREAQVTVLMKQRRTNRVTVIGAVETPGVYNLSCGSSDLLSALVAAGGLSKEAGTDIEIRHPARRVSAPQGDLLAQQPGAQLAGYHPQQQQQMEPPRSERINITVAAYSGKSGVEVRDGDVVMVQKRVPKPVQVIGLVNKQGQFEMPVNQEMRVLDALALAEGVSSQVADKMYVIRQVPGQSDPVVIQLSLREAKHSGTENMLLAPGDVVSVEQTPATVMLDAVKNFVHFGASAAIPLF